MTIVAMVAAAATATVYLRWTLHGTPVTPTRTPRRAQWLTGGTALMAAGCATSLTVPSALLVGVLLGLAAAVWWHDGGWFDIPDRLTVPAALMGVALSFTHGVAGERAWWAVLSPAESLMGLVAGAGVGTLLMWGGEVAFRKPALGFGDVTLLAVIGRLRGATAAAATIPVAAVLTLVGLGVARLVRAASAPAPAVALAPPMATPLSPEEHATVVGEALNAATDDEATRPLPAAVTAPYPVPSAAPDQASPADNEAGVPDGAVPFGIALRLAAVVAPWVVRAVALP